MWAVRVRSAETEADGSGAVTPSACRGAVRRTVVWSCSLRHAIAQTARRKHLNLFIPHGICGGRSVIAIGVSSSASVFLCPYHSTGIPCSVHPSSALCSPSTWQREVSCMLRPFYLLGKAPYIHGTINGRVLKSNWAFSMTETLRFAFFCNICIA